MTSVQGSFAVKAWNEEPYADLGEGRRLTRAVVTQAVAGGIDGEASVQWLMSYRPDGTAHFVGLQHIDATISDRQGSFVADTVGEFDGKVASWTWTVVDGSATDALEGLSGRGTVSSTHGGETTFELEYELPQ